MQKELTKIGFISKPFGFNGEIRCALEVNPISDELPKYIWIYIDGKPVPFYLEKFHIHNSTLILKFEDVSDEETAYSYKNTSIYCELDLFDDYFEVEENLDGFIGFKIEDINKGEIGEVISIIEHTIQPTLVLEFNGKEILIPYTEEIIKDIDEELEIIKINAPEGLIDLYLE